MAIDILSIFLAAQQAKNARTQGEILRGQLEAQGRQSDMERAAMYDATTLQEAKGLYGKGQSALLQQVNPAEYQKLEQGRAQMMQARQKQEQEVMTATQDRDANTAYAGYKAALFLSKNKDPDAISSVLGDLDRGIKMGAIDPRLSQVLGATAAGDRNFAALVPIFQSEVARKTPAPKPTSEMTNAAAATGFGSPAEAAQDPRFQRYVAQQILPRGPSTVINMGGGQQAVSPLTTGQQAATQKDIQAIDKRAAQIGIMERTISELGGYDKVGSLWERGGAKLEEIKKSVGLKSNEDLLRRRARVVAAIGGFTNPIISELAGANVPEGEFARMKESLPRPDDVGPVLQQKIEAWKELDSVMREQGVDALLGGLREGVYRLPESNWSKYPPGFTPDGVR
jgi:hypothetical protein